MKILMVCLGNICRSPMADGLLRKKVDVNNLSIEVDSAGTAAYHEGEAPDKRMQETAKKHSIDLSKLRARQFQSSDFENFDLIYAMDSSNYTNIVALARKEEHSSKVKLILEETHPNMSLSVPDPYYGGEEGFEEVYTLLDNATNVIIETLKK